MFILVWGGGGGGTLGGGGRGGGAGGLIVAEVALAPNQPPITWEVGAGGRGGQEPPRSINGSNGGTSFVSVRNSATGLLASRFNGFGGVGGIAGRTAPGGFAGFTNAGNIIGDPFRERGRDGADYQLGAMSPGGNAPASPPIFGQVYFGGLGGNNNSVRVGPDGGIPGGGGAGNYTGGNGGAGQVMFIWALP